MMLKDPYLWPRKSGHWWCSARDRAPTLFEVALVPFWPQGQRLGKSNSSESVGKTARTSCPSNKLAVELQSLSTAFRNNAILLFSYTGSFYVIEQLISANQYFASKIWTRHSKFNAMRAAFPSTKAPAPVPQRACSQAMVCLGSQAGIRHRFAPLRHLILKLERCAGQTVHVEILLWKENVEAQARISSTSEEISLIPTHLTYSPTHLILLLPIIFWKALSTIDDFKAYLASLLATFCIFLSLEREASKYLFRWVFNAIHIQQQLLPGIFYVMYPL